MYEVMAANMQCKQCKNTACVPKTLKLKGITACLADDDRYCSQDLRCSYKRCTSDQGDTMPRQLSSRRAMGMPNLLRPCHRTCMKGW